MNSALTQQTKKNYALIGLVLLIALQVFAWAPRGVQAAGSLPDCDSKEVIDRISGKTQLNIPLPGFTDSVKCARSDGTVTTFTVLKNVDPTLNNDLSIYLRAFYIYFVWIVGILAVVMVMYAGIQWITAAGNSSKIENAKSTMNGAFIGVVLTLSSYLILQFLNPELVSLRVPKLTIVNYQYAGGFCTTVDGVDYQERAKNAKIECGQVFDWQDAKKTTKTCMSQWCPDGKKTCFNCTGSQKPFNGCQQAGLACVYADSIVEIRGTITNPSDLRLKKIALWKRDEQFCSGVKGCFVMSVDSDGDHFIDGSSYVMKSKDPVQLAELHLELDFDGHDDCATATFRLPFQQGSTVIKVANINLDTCTIQ